MKNYPEPLVARVLGVGKQLLVTARKKSLGKGPDWDVENSVVVYTEAGLTKICAALGLDPAALFAPGAAEGGQTPVSAEGDAPGASAQGPEGTSQEVEPSEKNYSFARRDPAAAALAAGVERLADRDTPVDILVTGVSPNRILLFGTLDGRRVTVRVRSNANFIPGLVIQATPLEGENYFSMVGNPPRWRGDRLGFTRMPKRYLSVPDLRNQSQGDKTENEKQ